MFSHIMQLTTFRIHEGKLDAFKNSIRQAVAFARQNGPQLLVEVYIDEPQMRAHSCQIQPSSDAITAHWQMSDPYIRQVMDNCTLLQVELFGDPSQAVMDGMRRMLSAGVTLRVTPAFTGYDRFAA